MLNSAPSPASSSSCTSSRCISCSRLSPVTCFVAQVAFPPAAAPLAAVQLHNLLHTSDYITFIFFFFFALHTLHCTTLQWSHDAPPPHGVRSSPQREPAHPVTNEIPISEADFPTSAWWRRWWAFTPPIATRGLTSCPPFLCFLHVLTPLATAFNAFPFCFSL